MQFSWRTGVALDGSLTEAPAGTTLRKTLLGDRIYRPLADSWVVYDKSGRAPRLLEKSERRPRACVFANYPRLEDVLAKQGSLACVNW